MIEFRYSDEERVAILDALPPDEIPMRKMLLIRELEHAAGEYVSTSEARNGDVKLADDWDRIREYASKLADLLDGMGSKLDYRLQHLPAALRALRIDAVVESEQLQKRGRFISAKKRAQTIDPHNGPKQDAKVSKWMYCRQVLVIWLKAGGKDLGISTKNGKASGPLARYFEAVASPAMKDEMPAASSIQSLVREFKDEFSPERAPALRASFVEEYEEIEEGIHIPF